MSERRELLETLAKKCLDFARNLSHHRAFKRYVDDDGLYFWIYMSNNSIDFAILDWSKLFGAEEKRDRLHWKNVVTDKDSFGRKLYYHVNMKQDQWENYKNQIKRYRNKEVAHTEVPPKLRTVPEMDKALESATCYYEYARNELVDQYEPPWPYHLNDYYESALKQAVCIEGSAYAATHHIKERVG